MVTHNDTVQPSRLPAIQSNPFSDGGQEKSLANLGERQVQEVQAACVLAKKFPRNQTAAWDRIMESCKRPGLASVSQYSYPKGGKVVTGPSIRLAEECARQWGNIDFGVIELSRRDGCSSMMAYAWDLETNVRRVMTFDVSHERTRNNRSTGQKESVILSDSREVYEMNANQAARRLRACILTVIPADVVEDAVEACNRTLSQADGGTPIAERIKKLIVAFKPYGVTQAMIETRLGHNIDATTEPEIAELRTVFTSLKDGMSQSADWFPPEIKKGSVGEQKVDSGPAKEDPKPKAKQSSQSDIGKFVNLLDDNNIAWPDFVDWAEAEYELKIEKNSDIPAALIKQALKDFSPLVASVQGFLASKTGGEL